MFELRAATSLARLWRDQGKRTEGHDLIAPIGRLPAVPAPAPAQRAGAQRLCALALTTGRLFRADRR